jgi:predicted dehydrogenase
MHSLRFAMIGAGFWARFQLAAWQELEGARCVAICDRVRGKAEALARQAGISTVYDDPVALLHDEQLDFVDIVTDPGTHPPLVHLAAHHGVPVITQKPMAPSVAAAEEMLVACRDAGVPLLVHENWRWQTPLRQVHRLLAADPIGRPFRARIEMVSGFPVFDNQPYLKELDQFILADMGVHILDVARLLFGEAESVYCQTYRAHRDIKGEDVATVMMKMGGQTTVLCHMGFAGSYLEHDRFPETYLFIEGERGSLELGPDFWIRVTTAAGTHARRYPPPRYSWADPAYDVAHSSLVACNAHLLQSLRGEGEAETTGEDNLKTLRLVYEAYESALTGQAIPLPPVDAQG